MDKRKSIVANLYQCLSEGDTKNATGLFAADLEWRYHGPLGRDYMKRVLTGVENQQFRFKPRRIAEVGNWVIAEGWEVSCHDEAYWVHAWVVEDDVITQFREYFNTCVTVRLFGPALGCVDELEVWKSRGLPGRPLPGIVLAV